MKRILSLALVVLLAVSLFGCTDTSEKAAIKTAEDFMEAYIDFDKAAVEALVVDKNDLPDSIKDFDLESALDEAEGLEDYADRMLEIMGNLMNRASDLMSFEILSTEKKDDSYLVKVKAKVIDDVDDQFTDQLADAFGEDAMTQILSELYNEGKITADSSYEDIMAAVTDKALDLLEDFFDEVELTTTEKELSLVIVEKDGKWLIDADESDFAE